MSQHATELCVLLVDYLLGDTTAQVFNALVVNGRQVFHEILQRTNLTPRQACHSLAVLVQQRLVFWFTDANTQTSYEANWRNAYLLVRSGKLVQYVKKQYGDSAGLILINLCLSGQMRARDLEQLNSLKGRDGSLAMEKSGRPSQNNDSAQLKTSYMLKSTLHTLLRDRVLAITTLSQSRTKADNLQEAERIVAERDDFRTSKPPDKKRFNEAVENVLEKWRQEKYIKVRREHDDVDETVVIGKGKRRRLQNDANETRAGKKARTNDTEVYPNGPVQIVGPLQDNFDEDLVVQIDYERLAVAARNEALVHLVEKKIGKPTSLVYSALLRIIEERANPCKDKIGLVEEEEEEDFDLEARASTLAVLQALGNYEELKGQLDCFDIEDVAIEPQIHPKNRRRKIDAELDEDAEDNTDNTPNGLHEQSGQKVDVQTRHDTNLVGNGSSNESQPSSLFGQRNSQQGDARLPTDDHSPLRIVELHLLLLNDYPICFAIQHKRGASNQTMWSVPYRELTRQLRVMELEKVVMTRFGPPAHRIARMLEEKGKLDEKTIVSLSLLNQKVVRSALSAMHSAGYLELQEIPRDAQRQPSRTIFMWFFDPDRCCMKVLEHTYMAMARCLQRIEVEKQALQSTLEKAARTDVVGNESEFLAKEEMHVLSAWRRKEEMLLGEINRLDGLVHVLRDF